MALDVQPLSRGRRAAMLAVLLALLAGSLAFAQWLVVRANRSVVHERTRTVIVLPPDGD
jgi:hypothetical protein